MTQYPQELVHSLRHDNTHITMYGTDVQVKRIPDEPRPGHLDPRELAAAKSYFERMAAGLEKPETEMTLEEQRADMGYPGLNMNTAAIWTKYEEHCFDGNPVKIWIYYPRKPEGKTGRAGLVYYHGGGWIGGSPFDVEGACRLISERADCVVFNIDYSLAPEKPYPAGLSDCWNVLCHICRNAQNYGVDPNKLAVGGDSAGGNLAAACALRDRNEKTGMIKYSVLMYPVVTLPVSGTGEYRWSLDDFDISPEEYSYIEPALSLGRPADTADLLGGINGMYLQHGEDQTCPYISPMFAKSFAGLGKVLIAAAEFDGLRIQCEFFGKLLRADGVEVRLLRYKGMRHGFIEKLGLVPQAEDLVQEIAKDLLAL